MRNGTGVFVLAAAISLAAPTAAKVTCVGDCNFDGRVAISELVRAVNMALDLMACDCPAVCLHEGEASIVELVASVDNALFGCPDPAAATAGIVFNGEANRLNAYQPLGFFHRQTVIERASLDPEGRDVNGQICFTRGPGGARRFIAGEDTGQGEGILQGWGLFELAGEAVGDFVATQIGKLTPTYQPAASNPENYGCGFLSDGRLLTTDVGDQVGGPGNGQLIVWFPPFDEPDPRFCKLDTGIPTAQSIAVDDEGRVYVASARGDPSRGSGVYRYTGPFPTADNAAGGCGRVDGTGAPLVDEGLVARELFVSDGRVPTPGGLAWIPGGGFYIASVLNGVIAEYDREGAFVRTVLKPPAVETKLPWSTGTPLGLGLASDGTIYYADIGLVIAPGRIGPGPGLGKVRRIRFVDGEPQRPETLGGGLNFPDGIGVLESGD